MIPNYDQNPAIIGGELAKSKFEIAPDDAAHIMTILGSTLYSDKIAAVLREYGTNAADAHVSAGIADRPISVSLPTKVCKILSIRDFGKGLSHSDVFGVFKRFGGSTKRDDNAVAGMLGIGSKSGWAYRSTFTVVSRHGGACRTYTATAGSAGSAGDIALFDETPCDPSDTGLEICIAVSDGDIAAFQAKAAEIYKNFSPKPIFNVPVSWPSASFEHETPDGCISPLNRVTHNQWEVVMGNVTYPVDLAQLTLQVSARRCCGILKIKIGDVDVAASREALKYSNRTIKALEQKITHLTDEYIICQIKKISSSGSTPWQKRILSQKLNKIGAASYVAKYGNLADPSVSIKKLDDFAVYKKSCDRVHKMSGEIVDVPVNESTRIVLHDSRRALKRYVSALAHSDLVFVPKKDRGTAKHCEALLRSLDAAGCAGIAFARTSEIETEDRDEKPPAQKRSKHKIFVLDRKSLGAETSKNCWIAADTPSDSDLWVEMKSFRVEGSKNFYELCRSDQVFADVYGASLPRVVGYVKQKRKQVEKLGQSYFEWRKNFYAYACKSAPAAAQHLRDRRIIRDANFSTLSKKDYAAIIALLTPHSRFDMVQKITAMLCHAAQLSEADAQLSYKQECALQMLDHLTPKSAIADRLQHLDEIRARLPLLFAHSDGLAVLASSLHNQCWIEYIIRNSKETEKE